MGEAQSKGGSAGGAAAAAAKFKQAGQGKSTITAHDCVLHVRWTTPTRDEGSGGTLHAGEKPAYCMRLITIGSFMLMFTGGRQNQDEGDDRDGIVRVCGLHWCVLMTTTIVGVILVDLSIS